ncbi:MAG: glycosyltransferase family 2 protein [Candidatus Parcubacteria bacterium]|nr:glycosyltransferase family 2 protein [Burkholderiales bacterium]
MHPGESSLGWRFGIQGRDAQTPVDVAVVMNTILRPSMVQAIESVYRQDLNGTVQILIGVDKPEGSMEPLLALLRNRPPHVGALVLAPGYSTSERHGGLHLAHDGGALRTVLSYLANARLLSYLDDDNRWQPNHLSSLSRAITGFDWAFSLRMFVDARNGVDLCVDAWDSVGPGKGIRRAALGGFVDTNCLMIDKSRAESALAAWSRPLRGSVITADRRVFHHLRMHHPAAWTGQATVRYFIRPTFFLWPQINAQLRNTG